MDGQHGEHGQFRLQSVDIFRLTLTSAAFRPSVGQGWCQRPFGAFTARNRFWMVLVSDDDLRFGILLQGPASCLRVKCAVSRRPHQGAPTFGCQMAHSTEVSSSICQEISRVTDTQGKSPTQVP